MTTRRTMSRCWSICKACRLERLRDFGDVWMALGLWRLLGMDTLLQSVAEPRGEDVPWPVVAAILTIARFCKPSSELHIETTWYRATALEDLLGVPVEKVHTDRLYEGLDWLLPHKAEIEKHLKERLGTLFDLEYDLLLYDVTSTYFEGACAANGLAKRGYSRDSRPDCLQVCIGLVVTTEGIPLGYEVFAGNRNDATTVEEIVESMEKKYGRANRVWVMDRGMVSEDNLKFLRQRNGQYIVGTPKAMLRQFEEYLTRKDWREVQEGVEVQLVPGPEGDETFVLARSVDRREKEKAMHQRFVDRLEAALRKMQASAASWPAERRSGGQPAVGAADVPILAGGRSVRREDRTPVAAARESPAARQVDAKQTLERLGVIVGGLLPAADEPERDRSGHVVETLHPVDRRGMGVSDHQRRTGNPPDLAPKDRPRAGAHPGLLPGVCVVEDAGPMDAAVGPGRCAAHGAGGTGQDQERRRGAAHRHQRWPLQRHSPAAVRYRAGRGPKSPAPPPRNYPAKTAPTNRRVRTNVVETFTQNRT